MQKDHRNHLVALNLPSYPVRISENEQHLFIFDEIRKKQLVLTPEEWVRQHFIQFLVRHHDYPSGLISIEHTHQSQETTKRSDIIVYDRKGFPFLLVECKAPQVKINQKTFDQAYNYNKTIKAPFMALSNGINHFFLDFQLNSKELRFLKDVPTYF